MTETKFDEWWNNYGKTSVCRCNGKIPVFAKDVWVAATKAAESQSTDTQKLKAEIRSVVDDFVCIPPVRIAQEIDNLIYKLRELSAV